MDQRPSASTVSCCRLAAGSEIRRGTPLLEHPTRNTASSIAGTRHPSFIATPCVSSRTAGGYYDVRKRSAGPPPGRPEGGPCMECVPRLARRSARPYHARLARPSAGARGRVAQLVEQGIENPRVGGSIPSPATMYFKGLQ